MGKAVKSVTKGVSKAVKGVVGGVSKAVGGLAGDILSPLTGADAIAKADKEAQRIAQEQAILAQNLSADLGIDNVAQIEAGGTAATLAERRRRGRSGGGSSVASSIGLNV